MAAPRSEQLLVPFPQDLRKAGVAIKAFIQRAAIMGSAAALALGAAAAAAVTTGTAAQAASSCTTSGTTITCTYTGAGTYSFTVPAGVISVDVHAVGAAGGATCDCRNLTAAGGPGASVEDTAVPVSVYRGQALAVIVGGVGGTGGFFTTGGAGGSPGGGGAGGTYPNGDPNLAEGGGGGGGYSGLLNPSGAALVVAAGGGGAGYAFTGGAGDTGSGGGAGAGYCDCLASPARSLALTKQFWMNLQARNDATLSSSNDQQASQPAGMADTPGLPAGLGRT